MEKYYYHGIEFFLDEEASVLDQIIKIINSGAIKTSNNITGKDTKGMNHICLFKKNEDFDYEHREPFPIGPMSALDAWIGNGLVFVISPDINAYQAKYVPNYNRAAGETNIIDEWRTNENIPLEKVVGLALPLDVIREEIKENKIWEEKLNQIFTMAKEYEWFIVNSEDTSFTDKLDADLNNKEHRVK